LTISWSVVEAAVEVAMQVVVAVAVSR